MPILEIHDFSCIRSALLDLRPITVLIGPQAAGKSVIAKLFYFFSDILIQQYDSAEREQSFALLKKSIVARFTEWFPPSTWGNNSFEVRYEAGAYECRLYRRISNRRLPESVKVDFSQYFEKQYDDLLTAMRAHSGKRKSDDEFSPTSFEFRWKARNSAYRRMKDKLKSELISTQIFIPAGRSFYTNLGKAFAMLEHGSPIDEITKRFGRLFTNLLDGERHYYYGTEPSPKQKDFLKQQREDSHEIFEGRINLGVNDRHVATKDGRKIPLSILSSGQQELLPLILVVQHFTRLNLATDDDTTGLLYIEEPEAHLFPSAQGALVAHLASVSNFTAPNGFLFVTTHSPYVLSKLNTMIKAFSVAQTKKRGVSNAVSRVVPRSQWLAPGKVLAYTLEGGKLESIKDEGGLLNGEYLDSISSEISADFMELLGIESRGY